MIKLVISLIPITKKNHQQILKNRRTGKPFIAQSKQYQMYEKECVWLLKEQYTEQPIDYPVNIKALYYMPTRRMVDLNNLHSALHDILVKTKVFKDDNYKIIAGTDGSRVLYDRNNPRTEVYIEKFHEENIRESNGWKYRQIKIKESER